VIFLIKIDYIFNFLPIFLIYCIITPNKRFFIGMVKVANGVRENHMPVVDAMNRRILQLLVDDGRMTHNEIAAKLKRSPSTVRDRIRRMEDDGIILGYFAVVNNERMGISLDAILLANLRQGVSPEELRKLKGVEEVKEILQISGPRRIMVRLQARDSSSLEYALSNKVLPLGLEDTELRMVMSSANRLPGN